MQKYSPLHNCTSRHDRMKKIIKGDTLKTPKNIFTLIMNKCRLALAIAVKNVLNSYLFELCRQKRLQVSFSLLKWLYHYVLM